MALFDNNRDYVGYIADPKTVVELTNCVSILCFLYTILFVDTQVRTCKNNNAELKYVLTLINILNFEDQTKRLQLFNTQYYFCKINCNNCM